MYELVEEASKVLRTPPLEFDFENPYRRPKRLKKSLTEAMEKFGGIGLSANQVGLDARVFCNEISRPRDSCISSIPK